MNCHECRRVVYLTQTRCQCGATLQARPVHPARGLKHGEPDSEVKRAFAKRLTLVNGYIEEYRAKHPRATKQEACTVILKKKKLISMAVGLGLVHPAENEADSERAAIQNEA